MPKTDSTNFKVDKETYKKITEAVLDCAEHCYFRAQKKEDPVDVIKEEYRVCTDKIFKLLGGEINA